MGRVFESLRKGRSLDVYDRLSTEDAADYDKLKDALLKNFDMTERGFRKKFRYSRPERSETFIQYSSRLCSDLNKWLTMAKIEKSLRPCAILWRVINFLRLVVGNCLFI